MEQETLSNLGYDQFKNIFIYLTLKDLSALACTSNILNTIVNSHWNHLCKKFMYKKLLSAFLEAEGVAVREKKLLQVLKSEKYSIRWLYVNGSVLGYTKRKFVVDITNFPHKGDKRYIPVIFDVQLKRNAVKLVDVCWLFMSHKFTNACPGTYVLFIRMKLHDVRWPETSGGNCNTLIITTWEDKDGPHKKQVHVSPQQWKTIEANKNTPLNGCTVVDIDSDTNWFTLKCQSLTINEICDVTFAFQDVVNRYWKRGMQWDYVELKPVI